MRRESTSCFAIRRGANRHLKNKLKCLNGNVERMRVSDAEKRIQVPVQRVGRECRERENTTNACQNAG